MTQTKLTGLTSTSTVDAGDIMYVVRDPTGSKLDRRVTVGNLFGSNANVLQAELDQLAYNPKSPLYGGLGNGSDETALLQACLTDALAAGSPTYLPKGTWGISAPLKVGHQKVFGPGYNNQCWLKALTSFSGTSMIQQAGAFGTQQTWMLEDFAIDGNYATATVPAAILIDGGIGQPGYIRNMLILNVSGYGIKMTYGGGGMTFDGIWINHTNNDNFLITQLADGGGTPLATFPGGLFLRDLTLHAFASGKAGLHIVGLPNAIDYSHQIHAISVLNAHLEVMNSGDGILIESASNIDLRNVYYVGVESHGNLVRLTGASKDTFNIIIENLSKYTGTLDSLLTDSVSSRTITSNSLVSYTLGNPQVAGRSVQGDDKRATLVVAKTGLSSSAATGIFTISTTDESSSQDGGTYVCNIHAMVAHAGASANNDGAVKNWQGSFSRAMGGPGTGVNSAVENIFSGTSVATTSANRDLTTIAVDVVETSEYVQTVRFAVTLTGTGGSPTANVTVWVELLWAGFKTPPVIAAA